MRRLVTFAIMTAFLLAFGLIVGCSQNETGSQPQTVPAGQGGLQIFLTDAPGDYDAVIVEVVEVRVHRNQEADTLSGWQTVSVDTTLVDLLQLSGGNSVLLAEGFLPAGHYEQIRLMLGQNNSVVVDSVAYPLDIPSSARSGLKLNHGFRIEEGAIYAVTLDFDADRSIHRTGAGQYKMRPVIRIVVNDVSGSLSGVVEPVDARAMVMTTAGLDTVVAWADTLTGWFSFPLLAEGSYDLAIGATAGAYLDTILTGVEVLAGFDTDLGTVVLQAE